MAGRFAPRSQVWPIAVQVFLHRFGGAVSHRDNAVLVPLPVASTIMLIELKILNIQVGQFRDAAAGGVHEFQNCPITAPMRLAPARCCEEPVHITWGKNTRHTLPQSARGEKFRLVLPERSFQLEIPEEHFQRDHMPADTTRSQILLSEPCRISAQIVDRQSLETPAIEPFEEPSQIALVRKDRILGQVTLAPKVANEIVPPLLRPTRDCHSAWYNEFSLGHGRQRKENPSFPGIRWN